MLIGITGLIGSGKTEVSRIFKQQGAFVISADKVGKEVVENDKSVLKQLVGIFGKSIITPSGSLRRRKLGELAFKDIESRNKLNKIVHPRLLKELKKQSSNALQTYNIVVIDAALLIFWGWHEKVDLTILVHAGREIRQKRLLSKGLSKKEFEKRSKAQLKFAEMRLKSDIMILNNKSLDSLERKVLKLVEKIAKKS